MTINKGAENKLIINSREKERKKEEEKLIININNTKQSYYARKSLAFLINNEVLQVLDFMEKRALLDGYSFNQLAFEAFKEYMQRHPIPNPQTSLERITRLNLPAKSNSVCCLPTCKRKTSFILTLKNYEGKQEIFPVCSHHERWRHSEYKFLVYFKKVL